MVSNAAMDDVKTLLETELRARRTRNPSYSLRAFARDLGLSPASLSEVLAGKRKLARASILRVADALSLSGRALPRLLSSNGYRAPDDAKAYEAIDDDVFSVIADWYYFAVLQLAQLPGTEADATAIGARLAIQPWQAQNAIDRLADLGMLRVRDGYLEQVSDKMPSTRLDIPSAAVRKHHRGMLEELGRRLESTPVPERDFTTVTFAGSSEQLAEVKKLLMQMKRRVVRRMSAGRADRVYALAIQLCPLTLPIKTPARR